MALSACPELTNETFLLSEEQRARDGEERRKEDKRKRKREGETEKRNRFRYFSGPRGVLNNITYRIYTPNPVVRIVFVPTKKE